MEFAFLFYFFKKIQYFSQSRKKHKMASRLTHHAVMWNYKIMKKVQEIEFSRAMARHPISRRAKPSGQSIQSTAS